MYAHVFVNSMTTYKPVQRSDTLSDSKAPPSKRPQVLYSWLVRCSKWPQDFQACKPSNRDKPLGPVATKIGEIKLR